MTWSTCSTYPPDLRFRLSIGRSRTGLNWISIRKPNYPSALAHWKLVLETCKLYSYLFKHGLHINNYHIRYLTQHIDFDHLYKGQETSLEGKGKQLLLPTRHKLLGSSANEIVSMATLEQIKWATRAALSFHFSWVNITTLPLALGEWPDMASSVLSELAMMTQVAGLTTWSHQVWLNEMVMAAPFLSERAHKNRSGPELTRINSS